MCKAKRPPNWGKNGLNSPFRDHFHESLVAKVPQTTLGECLTLTTLIGNNYVAKRINQFTNTACGLIKRALIS